VPLLARGVLVGGQDGVDDAVEGTQHRGRWGPSARVLLGLGLGQDLADLAPGVAEGAGDLANAHAVAEGAANPAVVVHRQHPCLRSLVPGARGLLERMRLGWVHFTRRSRAHGWVPFARRLPEALGALVAPAALSCSAIATLVTEVVGGASGLAADALEGT